MYANANPLAFVDPTGHTAEGAELQGVLRETKEYFQSQAKGSGITGILKGIGFGILSGAVGIAESAVGLIDEGATVTYTVPGVDVMGDPTGVESREEIKQQVADLKQTYHVIKEEGFFNAASRIVDNATDTLIAAAKGDPQAIAKVTSFTTEIAAPTAALKGSGALGAMRRGAKDLVEGAGRAVRHGWDEAGKVLGRSGDDVAQGAHRYKVGDRLPDGRIAGDAPGAAPALREAFIERGPVRSRHYSESLEGRRLHEEAQAFRQRHAGGSNPHRNYVTADVEVNGATRTVRFKNDPHGMHSEQRLVAWQQRMKDRLRKQGKDPDVFVRRLYTERPPCGAMSMNCRDLLGNEYGQYLDVFHGDR